jgi:hypothetical protein
MTCEKNNEPLTGGLAKLGLDKLSFNILSLSSFVRADTTSPGSCAQLQIIIINQHRFRADNWKIPNFAKPRNVVGNFSRPFNIKG